MNSGGFETRARNSMWSNSNVGLTNSMINSALSNIITSDSDSYYKVVASEKVVNLETASAGKTIIANQLTALYSNLDIDWTGFENSTDDFIDLWINGKLLVRADSTRHPETFIGISSLALLIGSTYKVSIPLDWSVLDISTQISDESSFVTIILSINTLARVLASDVINVPGNSKFQITYYSPNSTSETIGFIINPFTIQATQYRAVSD